jgi:hypothetical protein
MVTRVSLIVAVVLFLAVALSMPAAIRLAAAPDAPQQGGAAASGMGDMKQMHEKMMAEMKAGDARLDALVKTMNAASSNDAKTNAVAAVVSELVAQHKAMHGHMNEMHQHMMMGQPMMGGRGRMGQ